MTAGIEVTDPDAYRRRLDGLLAGREPLDVLAETPQRLRELFRVPVVQARARPFEGRWTPLEVLGHLIDAEWSFGWRLRTVFGDERPTIEPMDQDAWVARQRHNDRDPTDMLDEFETLRRRNFRLWRDLTDDDLRRVGAHRQRGDESLGTMRVMLAGHDLSHLDQIARYLAAVETSDPA